MKIRAFIIIIMLIAFYPFIGGQKGCSGQIELPDQEAEISIDTAVPEEGEEVGLEAEAETPEGEGSGPENLLEPEPEDSDKPEDKPENPPPPGVGFLPNDADLYVAQDLGSLDVKATKDSIESIGFADKLRALFEQSAKLLNLPDKDASIGKLRAVSAACFLSKDKAKIDTINFRFTSCDQFIFVDVFREDFQTTDMLSSANQDDMGRFIINDKVSAVKPAEKVLVVGSRKLIEKMQGTQATFTGTIDEKNIDALSSASPSSAILMGEISAVRVFQDDPLIGLFEPMYRLLKVGSEYHVLSAIEFSDRVKMSTVVRAPDGEKEPVEKIFMEYSYDEFAFIIDDLSKKRELKATSTGETISPTRVESTTTLQRAETSDATRTITDAVRESTTTDTSTQVYQEAEQPERKLELQRQDNTRQLRKIE